MSTSSIKLVVSGTYLHANIPAELHVSLLDNMLATMKAYGFVDVEVVADIIADDNKMRRGIGLSGREVEGTK